MKNARHSKPKILVIGSSNMDLIVHAPRLPRPGETISEGSFSHAPGGKGANQAVAAARAGGEVTFIGRVGKDSFGAQAFERLTTEGVNVEGVRRSPRRPTGVALIVVGENGENSIAVAPGANATVTAADIHEASPAFPEAGVLLIQMEIPARAVEAAARKAARQGIPVILNPAPAGRVTDQLLRHVSILTPNEAEAAALTGLSVDGVAGARRAAEQLCRRGPKAVIITLGARGALVWENASGVPMPGHDVEPVDTTAAGDIFNGALAVALGEGRPLVEAARFANAAAAISVTRCGGQASAPKRAEIESFLARNPPQSRSFKPRKDRTNPRKKS